MIRILIHGIMGRMGRAVYATALAQSGAFSVVAGVDVAASGSDFACPVYTSLDDVKETPDIIIDFTVPATLPNVLRYAQAKRIPAIIATTGLSERDMRLIRKAAERIPVFQTGNMSLGVNVQLTLAKEAAAALGENYEVEIVEKHHHFKIDAPSGTALMLADAINAQKAHETEYVYGRHEKNKRRTASEIGIHSIRGGTIPGEHKVMFIGEDEIVEISHIAYSKQVFACGALRAASFLVGRDAGLYNMESVVTEHDVASRLSVLDQQALITVSGSYADSNPVKALFDSLAAEGVFIDMISLSHAASDAFSIGVSLRQSQLLDAFRALKPILSAQPQLRVVSHSDMVKCTVEGAGMALRHGVASELFDVLSSADIQLQLVTTSDTKIEFLVDSVDAHKAVDVLKNRFHMV